MYLVAGNRNAYICLQNRLPQLGRNRRIRQRRHRVSQLSLCKLRFRDAFSHRGCRRDTTRDSLH